MTITELQERETQIEKEIQALNAELDFIYDRYADFKDEAELQASEAFPGQPKRRA